MSRTKKRETSKNPASKFIKLSGVTGKFGYWDKDKGDTGQTVELEYPIVFLPLDVLSTIKGYNDNLGSGFYSNEVHNIQSEVLNVRVFDNGEFAKGFYCDIKEKVKNAGGKFANSVYAMMYDKDGSPEIVNFQFYGASLTPFIDFQKQIKDIYKTAIKITGVEPAQKGTNHYFVPIFATKSVSAEATQHADDLDEYLQKYLDQYKLEQTNSTTTDDYVPDDSTMPTDDDVPFGG